MRDGQKAVCRPAGQLSAQQGCANLSHGDLAQAPGTEAMAETVTIVDYHAGNLTSVRLAIEKLGHTALVTSEPARIREASRLIFPGVGAAGAAMATLASLGLGKAIVEYAASGRPMLGICLGAQVILDHSAEGDVPCLGILPGRVERLDVPPDGKVPHMGWNSVSQAAPHDIWEGIGDGSEFYFVHSYAPVPAVDSFTLGLTDYYGQFTSALARDNVVACQFHPERSGRVGLRLLENFLRWKAQPF